jgi:beta-phosphoglucomutase-like phosphatase (HAD superfamily)
MKRSRRCPRLGLSELHRAFDEARFGDQRTLNLRESLPTVDAAATRVDVWLRQQQVERADEVLIITGRGNQSEDGTSPVRAAVERLLYALRRRGVIVAHREHSPGSFVVELAPVSSLWESPRRNRGRGVAAPPPGAPPSLDTLDVDTRTMLRHLAERALEGLGVRDTSAFVRGEMLKQFGAIAATVGDAPGRGERFKRAVRAALDQYE